MDFSLQTRRANTLVRSSPGPSSLQVSCCTRQPRAPSLAATCFVWCALASCRRSDPPQKSQRKVLHSSWCGPPSAQSLTHSLTHSLSLPTFSLFLSASPSLLLPIEPSQVPTRGTRPDALSAYRCITHGFVLTRTRHLELTPCRSEVAALSSWGTLSLLLVFFFAFTNSFFFYSPLQLHTWPRRDLDFAHPTSTKLFLPLPHPSTSSLPALPASPHDIFPNGDVRLARRRRR